MSSIAPGSHLLGSAPTADHSRFLAGRILSLTRRRRLPVFFHTGWNRARVSLGAAVSGIDELPALGFHPGVLKVRQTGSISRRGSNERDAGGPGKRSLFISRAMHGVNLGRTSGMFTVGDGAQ